MTMYIVYKTVSQGEPAIGIGKFVRVPLHADGNNMEYTIQKLGKMAEVSTRTLRYYDEIGLLKPSRINSSGYRIYGQKEVDMLQQILFFREFGLSLDKISKMIHAEDFDRIDALNSHLISLQEERKRLNRLIKNLNNTILKEEGKVIMNDKEKFEGFKKNLINENEAKYGKEIRAQYGEETIDKSNAKMMNLSEDQYEAMQNLGSQINSRLESAVKEGLDPTGEEGKAIAEMHKEWIAFCWYSYSKEAHLGLVQMYVNDERFTKYYDNNIDGCAEFLRDAVENFLSEQ